MLLVFGLIVTFIVILVLHSVEDEGTRDEIATRIFDSLVLLVPLFYTSTALVEYLKTLFDEDAALLITPEGIDDNLSIFSCGRIAWSEIAGVEIIKFTNVAFLIIKPVNTAEILKRQGFLKRRVLMGYVRKWKSPIIISEKRIAYDLYKLKNILTVYLK